MKRSLAFVMAAVCLNSVCSVSTLRALTAEEDAKETKEVKLIFNTMPTYLIASQ